MVSTPSPSLQLEIPGTGDYRGIWDQVMTRLLTQLDKAIAGVTDLNVTGGSKTLTDTQYVDNESRQAVLRVAGALTANQTIVVPARSKRYVVVNNTTGGFTLSIKTAAGGAFPCPAQGSIGEVFVQSDNSIIRLGPYVDKTTGAITSTNYALQASLDAEIARAEAEEATHSKTDGSRAFSAPVSGVTPTANAHLATKQYVDIAAGLQDNIYITAGTSTAYVVTTGSGLALFDGLALTIRPHATNGQSPTLVVDGSAAKPIRGFSNKSLPPGIAVLGTPYRVIYILATDEWLFTGFFDNPYNIPIGGFLPFLSTAVPNSNFVLPFGQAVSRTTYSALWNLCGTAFGAGDGANTFNLPDLRGRSIFGLDNMGGAPAGRLASIAGTTVGAAAGADTLDIPRSALPNLALAFTGNAVPNHQHFLFNTDTTDPTGLTVPTPNNYAEAWGPTGNTIAYRIGGTPTPASIGLSSPAGGHTPSGTIENINGGVPQTPINKLPPMMVLPFLLRVI